MICNNDEMKMKREGWEDVDLHYLAGMMTIGMRWNQYNPLREWDTQGIPIMTSYITNLDFQCLKMGKKERTTL